MEVKLHIKLDTKKLLGFRLYSAEAVKGKQGGKTGGFEGSKTGGFRGLKTGGLAGVKNGNYTPT